MSVAWNNGVFSPTYPGEVNPESGTIDEIAAAERRGYERAVARLRDREAWATWRKAHAEVALNAAPGDVYADYLDAAKESNE